MDKTEAVKIIRKKIIDSGLTQKEIASQLCVTPHTFSGSLNSEELPLPERVLEYFGMSRKKTITYTYFLEEGEE